MKMKNKRELEDNPWVLDLCEYMTDDTFRVVVDWERLILKSEKLYCSHVVFEASINSSPRDINLAARYVSLELRNKSWEISILDCILNDESECLLGYGRTSGKKLDASSVLRNMEFRQLERREKPGGLKKLLGIVGSTIGI